MSADISAEVRLAQTEADRDAVFAVRHQVFVDEQSVPEELEYDELDLAADHFLALLDGVPVGAGRLVIIDSALDAGLAQGTAGLAQGTKAIGILGRLAVGKAARGMGLGKLLVRAIEQRAAECGLAAVELHAQTHARGFYQQLGYAAYGDLFSEAGIEHISMRKELQ
jgi:predicted GNAT family N-acyltransferase